MRKKSEETKGNNMLRIFYTLILLVVVTTNLFSQTDKYIDDNKKYSTCSFLYPSKLNWGTDVYASNNYIVKSLISDGNWIQYFDTSNTKIARVFQIEDYMFIGKVFLFNLEQNLIQIKFYRLGKLVWKTNYFSDFKLIKKDSIAYDESSRIMFYKKWFENGRSKYRYSKKKQIYWYSTGAIKLVKEYCDEKNLNGRIIFFDKKGFSYKFSCVEGKYDRCVKVFDKNMNELKKIKYTSLPKNIKKLIEFNFL